MQGSSNSISGYFDAKEVSYKTQVFYGEGLMKLVLKVTDLGFIFSGN